MPGAWEPKLRPGLVEQKGVSEAFLYCPEKVPWVRYDSTRHWGGARDGRRTEERKVGATGRGPLLGSSACGSAVVRSYTEARATFAAARRVGSSGLLEVQAKSTRGGAQAGSLCCLHWGSCVRRHPSVLHLKKQREKKGLRGLFCGLTQPLFLALCLIKCPLWPQTPRMPGRAVRPPRRDRCPEL